MVLTVLLWLFLGFKGFICSQWFQITSCLWKLAAEASKNCRIHGTSNKTFQKGFTKNRTRITEIKIQNADCFTKGKSRMNASSVRRAYLPRSAYFKSWSSHCPAETHLIILPSKSRHHNNAVSNSYPIQSRFRCDESKSCATLVKSRIFN